MCIRDRPYTPPPETLDPRGLDKSGLDNLLDNSDHSLIRTLAARANLGRIYGNAICSAAEIDSDDPADSLEESQRKSLGESMNKLLSELAEGQGAYIWFEEMEGLKSWNSAEDDPQARDSASGVISEFSPINLPFMDSNLRAKIADLSEAYDVIFDSICPAGRVVIVGNPMNSVPMDFATLLTKEIEIKTVFRYAHQYERAINLLSSNKIDVKPMITDTVAFDDSIKAFERAAKNLPEDVKIQIQL